MKHMTALRCNIALRQKITGMEIEVVILYLMIYNFIQYLKVKIHL